MWWSTIQSIFYQNNLSRTSSLRVVGTLQSNIFHQPTPSIKILSSCGPFNQNNLINYSTNLPSPWSSYAAFIQTSHQNFIKQPILHHSHTVSALVFPRQLHSKDVYQIAFMPLLSPVSAGLWPTLAFQSTVPSRPDIMVISTQGHIPPVIQQLPPSQGWAVALIQLSCRARDTLGWLPHLLHLRF